MNILRFFRPTVDRGLHCACWILSRVIFLAVVFIPSETYIVNLVTDDALYYPTMARSIASGEVPHMMGSRRPTGTTRSRYLVPWVLLVEYLQAI